MSKKRAWLIPLLFSLLLVTACGGNSSDKSDKEATQNGGTIKIGLAANPSSLDPIKYTSVYESNVIRQVGETLVKYNQDFTELKPDLATEWEISDDRKSYVFQLRDDVKFQKGEYQDGRKMTAEDVKYSLERSAFHSAMNRLSGVDSVEVTGDNEVTVNLKEPNAAFLAMLTDMGNIIVPQEEVDGWGDKFGQHIVGTGPFTLTKFQSGQQIDLKTNKAYWGNKSKLDGVSFRIIADANMMSNSLLSGDIDIATDVRGQERQVVEKAENVKLQSVAGFSTVYLDMNMKKGPTTDPKVREAMYTATNVKDIVDGVNQWGGAEASYSPLPKGSWGYEEALKDLVPAYDPKKAKEILSETDYADGFSINLYCADNRVAYATIFQEQMKKNLNIDVKIVTQEWGTYSNTVSSGKADLNIGGWSWYPDPYFYLNQEFHSDSIGSLGNGRGYSNKEVDELLDKAMSSTADQDERAKIYQDALQLIMDDHSRIELELQETAAGVSDKVSGFKVNPYNSIILVDDNINVGLKQ